MNFLIQQNLENRKIIEKLEETVNKLQSPRISCHICHKPHLTTDCWNFPANNYASVPLTQSFASNASSSVPQSPSVERNKFDTPRQYRPRFERGRRNFNHRAHPYRSRSYIQIRGCKSRQ